MLLGLMCVCLGCLVATVWVVWLIDWLLQFGLFG